MLTKSNLIKEILKLDNPIAGESRGQELDTFITCTINSDLMRKYLVLEMDEEILVYILTNLRIVRLTIDTKKIESSIFAIADIKEIKMIKFADKEEMQTDIILSDNSIGLIYPIKDTKIIEFFHLVDHLRIKSYLMKDLR